MDHPLLEHHERLRLRAAALRAVSVYPGPVGKFIAQELRFWEQTGFRFGDGGMVRALIDDVMKRPDPR